MDIFEYRQTEFPIEDIFVKRWSPRAMSGEPIDDAELMPLFEAARWAPSTYNEQEWRFLYAKRDTPHWEKFFGLLVEANQVWCRHAAALIVLLSKKTMTRNGNPNPVHSFDAGASWQNLALQGASMGLVVHGMAGFNRSQAAVELNVPEDFAVEIMIAVGKPAPADVLPGELRDIEKPSSRKPISEIAQAGEFSF